MNIKEERLFFIGIFLCLLAFTGWIYHLSKLGIIDGDIEAYEYRDRIECVFNGKLYTYENFTDAVVEKGEIVGTIFFDNYEMVTVDYMNVPCRKLTNRRRAK
jgi:hypothetical protein